MRRDRGQHRVDAGATVDDDEVHSIGENAESAHAGATFRGGEGQAIRSEAGGTTSRCPKRGASSRPSAGWPPASACRRHSWASASGTTIYSATDISSVSQGTLIDATPSSSATMGAKAMTMMTSFSATCDSVK